MCSLRPPQCCLRRLRLPPLIAAPPACLPGSCLPFALLATAPQELELALNEVTPQGAGAVAACVAAKPSLRRLNLRENELEDEGAVCIAKVGTVPGGGT